MNDATKVDDFTNIARRALASVLDEIVPPSSDGRLPGAGELGLVNYVEEALRNTPDLKAMIAQGLTDLDTLARAKHAPDFASLHRDAKLQLLNQQPFMLPLTLHTYTGYYQNARVVAALGLEARPPHPQGYHMEPNDLSLLDAVRRMPKLYREC